MRTPLRVRPGDPKDLLTPSPTRRACAAGRSCLRIVSHGCVTQVTPACEAGPSPLQPGTGYPPNDAILRVLAEAYVHCFL